MAFDTHANLISVTVTVVPSPAISGTLLSISNADATVLSNASLVAPFNVTIGPSTGRNETNQEIMRITNIGAANSGGAGNTQLTVTRQAETGGINRTILAGDTMKVTVTSKTATDIENAVNSGWTPVSDTPVYASPNTITINGFDRTAIYTKGTRVKFTNNGSTFFGVVISSVFSGGNTTVTLAPNSDYAIANSAITNPFYSYEINPQAYPGWFNFITTFTGFSVIPTGTFRFSIIGNTCFIKYIDGSAGTSNATTFTFTVPVPYRNTVANVGLCSVQDNGANSAPGHMQASGGGSNTVISVYKTYFQGVFTNSGGKDFGPGTFSYEF